MAASDRALTLTRLAAAAAADRLAHDIVALDVSDHLVITDVFLICSAPNDRQVRAIVDAVEEKLRLAADARPNRREGDRESRWVLLDYADLVVHVQHDEEREYYSLQRLWRDCPPVPLGDIVAEHAGAAARHGTGVFAAAYEGSDDDAGAGGEHDLDGDPATALSGGDPDGEPSADDLDVEPSADDLEGEPSADDLDEELSGSAADVDPASAEAGRT